MAGRPHKGDRVLLQTRPHRRVAELVEQRRHCAGVSSLSQYIADVLAVHAGRPDLVVELGHGADLELPIIDIPTHLSGGTSAASDRPLLQARPYRTIWEAIHRMQCGAGVTSVSRYVADVLALHVGREDLVVELVRDTSLSQQEELPLAM
ncbi:hypothetical protein DSM43518_03302 [Mycobacterium marinum]|uniref:hypothetical protein n=1 Tax=Mycobacterium marinum TaxID=1781 RepID=UPI000EEC10AA|nr:hypothetical protein [Mycobacterium marinum]RFZ07560.1 hypothetical protein DSM43518_03302 [Mycobacterium marinum]RFZ63231.1 hypothetical protein DE4576_04872 [Mycobacterium marinum]